MAEEWQIKMEGDQTGVPRWQWPLIGGILFAVALVLVFVLAALWS